MIFKRIKITKEQIKRAEKRFEFQNLNNSVTAGEGQITGALGEILLIDRCGDDVEDSSTFQYDLVIKGQKVEVKTKRQTVYPEPHHYVNFFDFNPDQQCDWYCFVVVDYAFENGWIVGWKSKEDFQEQSIFKKKGEKDDTYPADRTWTFPADCHCINIRDLDKPDVKRKNK
jgi:hypothetical protein